MTITIEPMREEHLPEVMQIERRVFQPGWSEEAFRRDLRNSAAFYLVLRVDGKIVGYAGGWFVVDEIHITNIAIVPEYREQGLGRRLLHRLLSIARERGMRRATLEVRIGNIPAQNLYKKFGFRPVGVRKRYYDDGEDALIMWLEDMDTPEYGAFLKQMGSTG
ncbi:Ribosomal-protein-alanine acetyltransferase [bacterium HR15]|uniref:Ribosomal-protein-alanine acetyltransferase n=1 Tax=uncultured prokaryote TaxID=198431 RepID=H5S9I7_9ZZZZ|nr:ribosomal-protein-alanine acetyltransferase [uncultured prokaryote]GBC91992.1 Ribosomal-protein-alanine acetyltransferase [bacterium HR15]